MLRWTVVGTVLQVVMVVVGHWIVAVANLFGLLGVAISLVVGLLWARASARRIVRGAGGGAVVGGACAFLGILLSLALGDVAPVILALGTLSSAVGGAVGGAIGARLGARTGAGTAP